MTNTQFTAQHDSHSAPVATRPSATRTAARRRLVIFLAGYMVVVSALVGGGVAIATQAEPAAPCATEDSAGPCYWDASKRDNGVGRSFYVDKSQHVHYAGE